MSRALDLRARLQRARLMLIFTPSACPPKRDPLEILEATLPSVDVIQVRVKPRRRALGTTPAREVRDWTRRVLERVASAADADPLVLVDDRVDVALSLLDDGLAGVHLGQDDCPVDGARELLGEDALIGLSTHDAGQVARADSVPADYLGFGPIFPTSTKGYGRGVGPEAAWVADAATAYPLFPIGGIDPTNATELASVGRAAVSAGVLQASDPGEAARTVRKLLVIPRAS